MTNAHQKCGKLHIRVSQSKKGEETIYTNTKVCFCKLLIEYNLVESEVNDFMFFVGRRLISVLGILS